MLPTYTAGSPKRPTGTQAAIMASSITRNAVSPAREPQVLSCAVRSSDPSRIKCAGGPSPGCSTHASRNEFSAGQMVTSAAFSTTSCATSMSASTAGQRARRSERRRSRFLVCRTWLAPPGSFSITSALRVVPRSQPLFQRSVLPIQARLPAAPDFRRRCLATRPDPSPLHERDGLLDRRGEVQE
jgi:hypothetical protein